MSATPLGYCIVCSPAQGKSPSITMYPAFTVLYLLHPPFPSRHHHTVVCVHEGPILKATGECFSEQELMVTMVLMLAISQVQLSSRSLWKSDTWFWWMLLYQGTGAQPNTVLNLRVSPFPSCGLRQLFCVCAKVAPPCMDILTLIWKVPIARSELGESSSMCALT